VAIGLATGLMSSIVSGVAMLLIPAELYLTDFKIVCVVVMFQCNTSSMACFILKPKGLWSSAFAAASAVLSVVVSAVGNSYPVILSLLRAAYITTYISLFIGFALQVILTVLLTEKSLLNSVKIKLRAMVGVLATPLLFSMVFANIIRAAEFPMHLELLLCFLYPVCIGVFKAVGESEVYTECTQADRAVKGLFELYSFLLAALPYRFIYFSLSTWLECLQLIATKFTYKVVAHVLVPVWSLQINALKCRLQKKQVQPMQPYFALGKPAGVSYSEFISTVSEKFVYLQFNDAFDIVSIPVLTVVSYSVMST
jgi:hypothetical protein